MIDAQISITTTATPTEGGLPVVTQSGSSLPHAILFVYLRAGATDVFLLLNSLTST